MDLVRLLQWMTSVTLFGVLTVFTGSILRTCCRRSVIIVMILLKVIAVPLLGLSLVYFDSVFTWRYNLLLGGIYTALLGSAAADLLRLSTELALRLFQKKGGYQGGNQKIRNWFRKYLGIRSGNLAEVLIILTVFLYGTVNMLIVTPRTWTVTSDRLEDSCKIVFLSDVHAGSAQSFSVISKMMEDVKREQPDLLVIGGDITDEFTTKEEAEKVWELIGNTGLPTVFVWGNHDRQQLAGLAYGASYTEEEITDMIENSGVRILADEYYELRPDVVLFGREDRSVAERCKEIDPAENPSPDAFFVILDHQQLDGGSLSELGGDLQLSGHSHAGQYFPLELIYTLAGAYPSGSYRIGSSTLIVSDGASGWGNSFRNQGHCHYEVICLEPEKQEP